MANHNVEYRLVKVGNEVGYFHCWEHYTMLVDDQLYDRPGQLSRVYAIVEFADGNVRHVNYTDLKFVDETNHFLHTLNCERIPLDRKGAINND